MVKRYCDKCGVEITERNDPDYGQGTNILRRIRLMFREDFGFTIEPHRCGARCGKCFWSDVVDYAKKRMELFA